MRGKTSITVTLVFDESVTGDAMTLDEMQWKINNIRGLCWAQAHPIGANIPVIIVSSTTKENT